MKYVEKFSNINQNVEDPEIEDNFKEDNFIFSLPPDDDDTYSTYSLLGGNMIKKSPLSDLDNGTSQGGDQIDLLMNGYQQPNEHGNNMNSIPMSDMTTSMGMNYSPHLKNVYVINQDDNSSGFYQSNNFPSANYPNRGQADIYYTTGPQLNYNYPGYTNQQYQDRNSRGDGQNKGRQLSSNAIAGKMLTSKNNGSEKSFGN